MSYSTGSRNEAIHTDACNMALRLLPADRDAINVTHLTLVQAMRDCHALGDSHPASRLASALLFEALGIDTTRGDA